MSVDVSFVTSGHDVADARLHRLVRACRRRGLRIEVLGLAAADPGELDADVRTWPRPSMSRRATLAARMAATARGRVLVALDPDSFLAVWGATRLSRLPGRRAQARRLVADVHENYADLLRDRAWAQGPLGVAARGVASAAARLAARSDLTLVADDHVEPLSARERVVVRNEPDIELLGSPTEPEPAPRAVYVGDVRTSRGLFEMVDGVAGAPDWTLDVIGQVAEADRGLLEQRLSEPDLAQRVRLHGRLAPDRSWEIARGAWVGLALLHDTPAFRDAVPSKLYEYLALGIVPVVSDLPRQRELVTNVGSGFVVAAGPTGSRESAQETAALLTRLAGDRQLLEAQRAAALRWRAALAEVGTTYDLAAQRIEALLTSR